MAKIKSRQAQAASAIRAEIKAVLPNIKARIKSQGYNTGSVVHIRTEDLTAQDVAAIEQITKKYEYGHYNGAEDYYEYDNVNDNLPQVTYVFVQNTTNKKES